MVVFLIIHLFMNIWKGTNYQLSLSWQMFLTDVVLVDNYGRYFSICFPVFIHRWILRIIIIFIACSQFKNFCRALTEIAFDATNIN